LSLQVALNSAGYVVFDAFQLEVILSKDGTSLRKVAWGLRALRAICL
jgi:hypothetical protein